MENIEFMGSGGLPARRGAVNVRPQPVPREAAISGALDSQTALGWHAAPLAGGLLGYVAGPGQGGNGAEGRVVFQFGDSDHGAQSIMVDSAMSTMADSPRSTIIDVTTLGHRLKRERLEAGLTQEALAKEAGVSKQAISQIETSQTKQPEAATLDPIARRLGVRTSWLLKGVGPKAGNPEEQSQYLGFEIEKIIDAQKLLREYAKIREESPAIADDARFVRIAYKIVDEDSQSGNRGEVVALLQQLSADLKADRESENGDQRRQAEGTGKADGEHRARRSRKA